MYDVMEKAKHSTDIIIHQRGTSERPDVLAMNAKNTEMM
jgi:hypothetical protein